MTDSRKAKLRTRWADDTFSEGWPRIIEKIRNSPFLLGDPGPWKVTFDWLIANDKNFVKVLEGNYDPQDQEQNESDRIAGILAGQTDGTT